MHFTRFTDLLLAGLIGLGAGYLLFQLASSDIPRLPLAAGAILGVLAAVDAGLAVWVRRQISGRRLTQAIVVARCVALAKASSLLGALMFGGWLGAFVYLDGQGSVLADDEVPATIVGAICAAALVAAALWLEHSCRTPDQQDPDSPDDSTRKP